MALKAMGVTPSSCENRTPHFRLQEGLGSATPGSRVMPLRSTLCRGRGKGPQQVAQVAPGTRSAILV